MLLCGLTQHLCYIDLATKVVPYEIIFSLKTRNNYSLSNNSFVSILKLNFAPETID